MTLRELAEIVATSPLPDDAEVVVVGHGQLHSLTHAHEAETGRPVLLCYVEEAESGAAGPTRGDESPGPRELSGGAAGVAPAEEVAAGVDAGEEGT